VSARLYPSVSVVVPTRDRPLFLSRALAGILAQRYPGDIECLVVFDQSEVSLPLINAAERSRVRALVNHRSPGLAGARNTGALAATGELIAFCDDDDEWLPNKLRLQAEARARWEAPTVTSGIYLCFRGREMARIPAVPTVTFKDLLRSRRAEIHPSTIVIEREALLDRIGLADERIPGSYAEDYEWLLRAAKAKALTAVLEPLVRVHWHERSWFAEDWETIVRALTYLLEKYPEFESEPPGLSRVYGQLAFAYAGAGRRAAARKWARRSLRLDPRQPRGYLAVLISSGVLSAELVLRLAHTFGRGV
jgi:glycosyltransferase involved in cell wall biosynthesis